MELKCYGLFSGNELGDNGDYGGKGLREFTIIHQKSPRRREHTSIDPPLLSVAVRQTVLEQGIRHDPANVLNRRRISYGLRDPFTVLLHILVWLVLGG